MKKKPNEIPAFMAGACRFERVGRRRHLVCGPSLRPKKASYMRAWRVLDEASAYQMLATANRHVGRTRLAHGQLHRAYRLLVDSSRQPGAVFGPGSPAFFKAYEAVSLDIEAEARALGVSTKLMDAGIRTRGKGRSR